MNASMDFLMAMLLRGLVLTGGTLLVHQAVRRWWSAATRHRLLACSMAGLTLMPVLIACCEGWPILPQISSPVTAPQRPMPDIVTSAAPSTQVAAASEPLPLQNDTPPRSGKDEAILHDHEIIHTAPAPAPVATRTTWREWLVLIWMAGTTVMMLRFLSEGIRLSRLRRSASKVLNTELLAQAHVCAQSIGLQRLPDMRIIDGTEGPFVIGLLRPTIILPAAFPSWPRERRRAVLLHEMAHVLRRDGLVQYPAALTCALHWCNPFAWLLLKRLRHEAECACDDAVLGTAMEASCYADHLLAVASGGRSSSLLAPSMAQPSGLRQRIQAVLSTKMNRRSVGRTAGFIILMGSVACCLPVMLAQSVPPASSSVPKADESATANSDTSKVSISLVTVDKDDKPLAGVTIRGFQTDKKAPITPFTPEFTAVTDEAGKWSADLPPGEYMVLATKDNLAAAYGENGQTWWRLNKKVAKRDLKLKLTNAGTVEVTVLDATSRKPVPQAKVILASGHTTITDDSGIATIPAVPMKEQVAKVVAPPFADTSIDFNSTGQAFVRVTALLTPGFEVRGRVTDNAGRPIEGAVVEDNYSGETFLVQMNVCATDADGRYTLGWYTKSKPLWSLSVRHDDYADLSRSNLPPPTEGTTTPCDFVLDQGNEIEGQVNDEEGNPIKGASMRYGSTWSLVGLRWARTNEAGKVRITKIGRKDVRDIVVEAEGYAPAWKKAVPGKGDGVPKLEFVLKKGLSVKGKAVDRAGNPVSGVTISPRAVINGRSEYCGKRVEVNAQGEFELKGLPETGNSLDAWGSKYSSVRYLAFDPGKPLIVTVDKPGVIMGRVLDATTREPVKKFNVRLGFPKEKRLPDEPFPSYSSHLSHRGQNSQEDGGRFVIEDLVSRAGHAVFITAEGYAQSYTDKVIAKASDDAAWPQEFLMDRGLPLLGRFTDAVSGNPVAGAKVYYTAKDKWYSSIVYASHLADLRNMSVYDDVNIALGDPTGAVELNLPSDAKAFTAVVLAPGYAPEMLENQSVAGVSFNIPPLAPEAKIRGTAAGLTDLNAKEDEVSVSTSNYVLDEVKLNPDGSFDVIGLPPGRAQITVMDPTGRTVRGSALIDLEAGKTATIDVAKQSPGSVKVIVQRNGAPVRWAQVGILIQTGKDHAYSQIGSGITNENGTAVLRHLPLVKGMVSCMAREQGQRLTQPLDLSDPNHPPEVRFELPPVK